MSIRRNFDDMYDLFERFDTENFGTGGMNVDAMERDDAYVVTADLPGFEPEDVSVRLQERTLTIEANSESTTTSENTTDGVEYLRRERASRSLNRSIRLPAQVNSDAVEANLTNGVLTVTLPKATSDDGGLDIDVE